MIYLGLLAGLHTMSTMDQVTKFRTYQGLAGGRCANLAVVPRYQ